jgi:hypothetical protein
MTIITGTAFAFLSPRFMRNCFNSRDAFGGSVRLAVGAHVISKADFSGSFPCPAEIDFTI